MEFFVGIQIGDFHAQQVFETAGHVVAFNHLVSRGDCCLKSLVCGLRLRSQADRHIGNESAPERFPADTRMIPANDTLALKVLHPAQTCRGGKPDVYRQTDIANSCISLQFTQYFLIYFVKILHLLRKWHKSTQLRKDISAPLRQHARMDMNLLTGLTSLAFVTSVYLILALLQVRSLAFLLLNYGQ
jgi:hypothetical protein